MPKPIKILFNARPMVDSNRSGIGRYTTQLIIHLAKNYESDVQLVGYYFNFLGRKKVIIPETNKNVQFIEIKLTPLLIKLGFLPYVEQFVRGKFDLMLFTNFIAFPSIRKTPKIDIIYDLSFFDHPEFTQEKNLANLTKFVPPSIERSDALITISDFTKSRINHYFPDYTKPVLVTPIPPDTILNDTNAELQERLTKLGISKKAYILYLGTIEPRKNIGSLIEAYAALPIETQNKYSLVLAGGKGWKDEEILNKVNLLQKDGKNIVLTGYVTDEERNSLYANASVYVLPSHYEGFGMPVLEAMSYRVPVAASDIPVFHEVGGDAIAYFNKDDQGDITKTLQAVLTDEDLQKSLITKSTEKLKANNWDKISGDVYDLIKQLVK